MTKENAYYIISTTGFGGPLFRITQRYQELGEPQTKSESGEIADNLTTSSFSKTNDKGELILLSARPVGIKPSSPKVKVAAFKPTNPEEYARYLQSRQPKSGPIKAGEIETTSAPKILTKKIFEEKRLEKKSGFGIDGLFQTIDELSLYPTQNESILKQRIQVRVTAGLPIRIGCFVCLNIKCLNLNNQPTYYIGQEDTRLESPKLQRRTQTIIQALEKTAFPFSWDFLLADTDPTEIYGEWLADPNYSQAIAKFLGKISQSLAASENTKFRLWSDVQQPYQFQYQRDFDRFMDQVSLYLDEETIETTTRRRLKYFDSLSIINNDQVTAICEITGKRNFALYAAQGPIINREYDLLVIADPAPLRLGQKQSLLCPSLPIWYPYPG